MRIGALPGDSIKVIAGLFHMLGVLFQEDIVPVSIAIFVSNSNIAEAGHSTTYTLELINNTDTPQSLNLMLDIYIKENPIRQDSHRSCFVKRVYVKGRSNLKVHIFYDWEDKVIFEIEGVTFPSDYFWRGFRRAEGYHYINAILSYAGGLHGETLTLVQKVIM